MSEVTLYRMCVYQHERPGPENVPISQELDTQTEPIGRLKREACTASDLQADA